MRLPPTLRHLAEALAKLPSIGPRQAIRLAVHVSGMPAAEQERLVQALGALPRVTRCADCGFPHEGESERCEICSDPQRSPRILMAVEKETDLLSMEKTGRYAGRYFIVGTLPRGGALSPAQQERLGALAARVAASGGLDELILGLPASPAGTVLAEAVSRSLAPSARKVTQLGRGLPRGGEIEFADEDTLGYSLDNRH